MSQDQQQLWLFIPSSKAGFFFHDWPYSPLYPKCTACYIMSSRCSVGYSLCFHNCSWSKRNVHIPLFGLDRSTLQGKTVSFQWWEHAHEPKPEQISDYWSLFKMWLFFAWKLSFSRAEWKHRGGDATFGTLYLSSKQIMLPAWIERATCRKEKLIKHLVADIEYCDKSGENEAVK